MSYKYKSLANPLIDQLGEIETENDLLTDNGAACVASILMSVPKEHRRGVFQVLDEKPGYWNYKDSSGRDWHHKVRQFRNHHHDLFRGVFAAS